MRGHRYLCAERDKSAVGQFMVSVYLCLYIIICKNWYSENSSRECDQLLVQNAIAILNVYKETAFLIEVILWATILKVNSNQNTNNSYIIPLLNARNRWRFYFQNREVKIFKPERSPWVFGKYIWTSDTKSIIHIGKSGSGNSMWEKNALQNFVASHEWLERSPDCCDNSLLI